MKEPFIKSINISVQTKDGGSLVKFLSPDKLQEILDDKHTLLSDFINDLIVQEVL